MPVLKPPKPNGLWQMPETVNGCVRYLTEHYTFLDEESQRGEVARECYNKLKDLAGNALVIERGRNPLKFLVVSHEQAIKLNAWIWGLNLYCDFDANRKGKTACAFFNLFLWIVPNDPEWKMYMEYDDEFGQKVHLLPRPSVKAFTKLCAFIDKNKEALGTPDPRKPFWDEESGNAKIFAILQKYVPEAFQGCYPEPPFSSADNTIWVGAPDAKYHKEITMVEFKKWCPTFFLTRTAEHDQTYELSVQYKNKYGTIRTCKWSIHFKSYESKDTKWSGAAVRGILLTEGLTRPILDEIKQRFQEDSFGSWDYTPYEARNVGSRSALAHAVYDYKEQMPLRCFVFSGYGISKTPSFILPEKKRQDLIRMWGGKAQGEARIHGKFFTNSPLVLSNYDKEFHTLPWTKEELFERFPTGLCFRGIDPGLDHPTSCAWGLLTPVKNWIIYRMFSERGLSIGQRCERIIFLSGNKRFRFKYGPGEDDYYFKEYHPERNSEVYVSTIVDHHVFKKDETTGRGYHLQYVKEGLVIRKSSTMKPEDRGLEFNRLLEKDPFKPHPLFRKPPGSRIYFLINEQGVAEGLETLENLFYERYVQGEHRGEPKDRIQSHGDDEFDAICYLICTPFRYSPSIKGMRLDKPEFEHETYKEFTNK